MHEILSQGAGLCAVYFPFMSLLPSVQAWGPELEVYCCRMEAPDPKNPMLAQRPAISPQKGTQDKVELQMC